MIRLPKERILSNEGTAAATLGPLELELMQILWSRGESNVRDAVCLLDRPLAYTTVMTTLDRLYKKQLLNRAAEGRAFRYSARVTHEELQRAAAEQAIRQLLGSGSSLPLSYLVEAVTEHDIELLDELQTLVERKRREVRDREK